MPMRLADLKVKLFTDGADKAQIVEMAKQPWIAGFTTNPSLLNKAGVTDYEAYARELPPSHPRRQEFADYARSLPEANPVRAAASEEFYDEEIESRQHKIAVERGYQIAEHSLAIYGNCVKVGCPRKQ